MDRRWSCLWQRVKNSSRQSHRGACPTPPRAAPRSETHPTDFCSLESQISVSNLNQAQAPRHQRRLLVIHRRPALLSPRPEVWRRGLNLKELGASCALPAQQQGLQALDHRAGPIRLTSAAHPCHPPHAIPCNCMPPPPLPERAAKHRRRGPSGRIQRRNPAAWVLPNAGSASGCLPVSPECPVWVPGRSLASPGAALALPWRCPGAPRWGFAVTMCGRPHHICSSRSGMVRPRPSGSTNAA